MDLESLRSFCKTLPHTTEDIKWEHDLCFLIGNKMYCVTGFTPPLRLSFKAAEEEFDELSEKPGFKPAAYLARYKWIFIEDTGRLSDKELKRLIKQSYELVKAKLPKKILKELQNPPAE